MGARIGEQRTEAGALEMSGQGQAGEFGERGIDVHELDQRVGVCTGVLHAGQRYDQRRMHIVFHVAVLSPRGVLAKLPTVVAPEDDDGVAAQIEAVELVEHASDLGIAVADAGVVAVLELAREVDRDGTGLGDALVLTHLAVVQIHGIRRRVDGRKGIGRERDLGRVVEVPVSFRCDPREVRSHETDGKEKRFGALAEIAQSVHREVGHFAIDVGVVGHIGTFVNRTECGAFRLGLALAGGGLRFFGRLAVGRFVGGRVVGFFARRVFRSSILARGRCAPRHGPTRSVVQVAVKNLPHALDKVAVRLEMLRQGHDVWQGGAEMRFEVPYLRGVRAGAREETGARGRADLRAANLLGGTYNSNQLQVSTIVYVGDYDKLAATFLAFVLLAAVLDWLTHVV